MKRGKKKSFIKSFPKIKGKLFGGFFEIFEEGKITPKAIPKMTEKAELLLFSLFND